LDCTAGRTDPAVDDEGPTMKDEGKDKAEDTDRSPDYDEWKRRYEAEQRPPREMFEQVSHIALFMAYDLIDKLRWWEKSTLELPDEEIAKRLPHTAAFLDKLRAAYLEFSETDV
jgi:hypothetical protein